VSEIPSIVAQAVSDLHAIRAQATVRPHDLYAIRDWARLAAAALAEDGRHAALVAKAGELGLIARGDRA